MWGLPVNVTVEVTGLRELQAKLNRLQDVGATLQTPFVQSAADIMTTMKEYPPASEANRPSLVRPWYERGYGTRRVRMRDGAIVGRKTSQMLNRSWSIRSRFEPREAEVIIGTRVTYARYVHDAAKQARFHKARGWLTVQTVAERYRAKVMERVEQAVNNALR